MPKRETLSFTAFGLATGVVTTFIQPFSGLLTDLIEAVLGRFGSAYLEDPLGWVFFLAPGLIFGAVIGWRIFAAENQHTHLSVVRWMLLAIAFAASWYVGIFSALRIGEFLPIDPEDYLLMGPIGGFVGAAVIAVSTAALYPFARTLKTAVSIIAAGTLAGVLLHVNIAAPHILFPVWQAVVAASLGWSLQSSRS